MVIPALPIATIKQESQIVKQDPVACKQLGRQVSVEKYVDDPHGISMMELGVAAAGWGIWYSHMI